MKLFFKEFGIWMGLGLLIPVLLNLFVMNESRSDYGLGAIIGWIIILVTTIIAITRLKTKHKQVSFGKSFLAGLVVILIFSIALAMILNFTYTPYNYYTNQYMVESNVAYALELFLISFFAGIGILLYVLLFAGMWYTFKKAGKPGYAMLVPIWNIIVLLEIAKKPVWWFAMFLIPIANIVFAIMALNGVSKNFGKSEGFTVGLLFLSPIFWSILGYGDAKYIDNVGKMQIANEDLLDS